MLMKILMIAPTPFFANRGCHIRILGEIRALCRRGHRVALATYHLGESPDGIEIYRIPKVPWYRKLEAGPSWQKPFLDLMLIGRSVEVARRFRPDVLYGHLHEGAFIAHVARRLLRLRIPLLFDVQDSLTAELRSHGFVKTGGMLDRSFQRIERLICDRADHFVCSSEASAQLIKEHFTDDPSHVDAMEDGVDEDFFSPRSGGDLRRRLRIPKGKKLVVYSGAMLKVKGIDFLLEAISILARDREDLHFLLVGYPVEELRERFSHEGISDRVTLTGAVPYHDLPGYLSLGDVAVDPKINLASESSAKIVFYMASGLPVVGFDTPVTRSYLGGTGIYAAAGSAQDLADKIVSVIDSPDRGKALGKKALERVCEHFAWDRKITIVERSLSRLLGGTREAEASGAR